MTFIKLLFLWVMVLVGIFVCPFLLLITPMSSTVLRFGDAVFGNSQDTINGDVWYPKWVSEQNLFIRTFPRYWWIAIRNPIQNLRFRFGFKGVIESVHRNKPNPHTLGTYLANAVVNGKTYHFLYGVWKYPLINRYFRVCMGPKIWEDAVVGKKYQAAFGISILPFISKSTAI